MVEYLPHIDAALNAVTTILLIVGVVLIRQKRIAAHRNVMLAAVVTSGAFLVCYLIYHAMAGSKTFPTDTDVAPLAARYFYYFVLLTHVVLAAVVPFLAAAAVYLGLKDRRVAHRKLVRWAWPIWMYVSVTGVVIYLLLYPLNPGS